MFKNTLYHFILPIIGMLLVSGCATTKFIDFEFSPTKNLSLNVGDRVLDLPISEQAMISKAYKKGAADYIIGGLLTGSSGPTYVYPRGMHTGMSGCPVKGHFFECRLKICNYTSSMLKFNLSTVKPANFTKAYLTFHIEPHGQKRGGERNRQFNVHQFHDTWNEENTTVGDKIMGYKMEADYNDYWASYDITEYAKSELRGDKILSVAIVPTDEIEDDYGSMEGPRLQIGGKRSKFEIDPEVATKHPHFKETTAGFETNDEGYFQLFITKSDRRPRIVFVY